MRNRLWAPLVVSALAAVAAPASAATTIGFEGQGGFISFEPATFDESGFRFSYVNGSNGFALVAAPPNCGPPCSFSGTNAFYSYNTGTLTVTRIDGGLFSLSSLSAAVTFTNLNRPLFLLITGSGASGNVSTTLSVNDGSADSFTTFSVNGFTNLNSLSFAGSSSFPEFALDNIVLSSSSAVPEPSTWAMMLLGFFGLGAALRSRRGVQRSRLSYR